MINEEVEQYEGEVSLFQEKKEKWKLPIKEIVQ